jgi:NodT family efflux transporter outer membrane factor (OMF) lipoprotein
MAVTALVVALSGCTSFHDYIQNGFKVGPNYCAPAAPVAQHWIDAASIRQPADMESLRRWWTVFNDPKLNYLVECAYHQNLTLREAGFRVLQSRAQLAIAQGNLFPQTQTATGGYSRLAEALSPAAVGATRFFDNWNYGFNLNWELDFWGQFRRAVAAADANLDASVEGYDAAIVTMLGDIAESYVYVRSDQEQIRLLKANVKLQREVLQFIEARFKEGYRQIELDEDQAVLNLKQTEAQIQPLEIDLRQREDQLCVLLGMPPVDLANLLGEGPIPTTPPEVAIGIPADLLRRRPDVRQAERLAAAQGEQIGIAEAALYPAFSIDGTLGYSAQNFSDLFKSTAFNGSVGPSFQWNLLNYGRLVNNVRSQDAQFQQLVVAYQLLVLQASQQVEDGLVNFLRSQRQAKILDESVVAADKAVKNVVAQWKVGSVDFNRYSVIELQRVQQQILAAQAHGQIAQGLIATYRALGGGWEIRLGYNAAAPLAPGPVPGIPYPAEELPLRLPATEIAPGQPAALPPVVNPPKAEEIPEPPATPQP